MVLLMSTAVAIHAFWLVRVGALSPKDTQQGNVIVARTQPPVQSVHFDSRSQLPISVEMMNISLAGTTQHRVWQLSDLLVLAAAFDVELLRCFPWRFRRWAGLPTPKLLFLCTTVATGHCLCGLAIASGLAVFVLGDLPFFVVASLATSGAGLVTRVIRVPCALMRQMCVLSSSRQPRPMNMLGRLSGADEVERTAVEVVDAGHSWQREKHRGHYQRQHGHQPTPSLQNEEHQQHALKERALAHMKEARLRARDHMTKQEQQKQLRQSCQHDHSTVAEPAACAAHCAADSAGATSRPHADRGAVGCVVETEGATYPRRLSGQAAGLASRSIQRARVSSSPDLPVAEPSWSRRRSSQLEWLDQKGGSVSQGEHVRSRRSSGSASGEQATAQEKAIDWLRESLSKAATSRFNVINVVSCDTSGSGSTRASVGADVPSPTLQRLSRARAVGSVRQQRLSRARASAGSSRVPHTLGGNEPAAAPYTMSAYL